MNLSLIKMWISEYEIILLQVNLVVSRYKTFYWEYMQGLKGIANLFQCFPPHTTLLWGGGFHVSSSVLVTSKNWRPGGSRGLLTNPWLGNPSRPHTLPCNWFPWNLRLEGIVTSYWKRDWAPSPIIIVTFVPTISQSKAPSLNLKAAVALEDGFCPSFYGNKEKLSTG